MGFITQTTCKSSFITLTTTEGASPFGYLDWWTASGDVSGFHQEQKLLQIIFFPNTEVVQPRWLPPIIVNIYFKEEFIIEYALIFINLLYAFLSFQRGV